MKLSVIEIKNKITVRDETTLKKFLKSEDGTLEPFRLGKWTVKEREFKDLLQDNKNTYLAHTGKSGIIAVDFDNDLFTEAMDIDAACSEEDQCKHITMAVGKPGGHMIYSLPEGNKLTEYINNPNGKKLASLDVLMGETLVLLTTPANTTKVMLSHAPELTPMPMMMQLFLMNYYMMNTTKVITKTESSPILLMNSKIGYIVESAINSIAGANNGKMTEMFEKLMIIVTTKHYKALLEGNQVEDFAYHPNNLPEPEAAQAYLVSIATILGRDISVNEDLFTKAIHYINSLFSSPKPRKEVQAICDYILSGSSQIEGTQVWQYNEDWNKSSFIFQNHKHETVEVFQYASAGANNYLVHNHISGSIKMYKTASAVIDFIKSVAPLRIAKDSLISKIKDINLVDRPDAQFGYIDSYERVKGESAFNLYEWTPEQAVFYQPHDYAQDYTYPATTLAALESSVGPMLYTHFLPFLRRKLMTRDHSPLFFVLFGVPHSFKSAIVNGVLAPLTHKRNSKVSIDVLTDKYNDWQVNTDVVLLDEVHHLVTADRIKMIKAINEITGNQTINGVRAMHSSLDNEIYAQEITFFLTTNETTQLTTEAADRRMVVFRSLSTVAEALGLSNVEIQKRITAETKDFAFYLSTEVDSLKGDAYVTNHSWKDENYKLFQEQALTSEDKLIKAVDTNDFSLFCQILIESGFTAESIASCIYYQPRLGKTIIRILNSRPDAAETEGLFDHSHMEIKILKKKLQLIRHVTYGGVEYSPGTSIKTGSRKTEWAITEVPEDIAKYMNKHDIQEIEDID